MPTKIDSPILSDEEFTRQAHAMFTVLNNLSRMLGVHAVCVIAANAPPDEKGTVIHTQVMSTIASTEDTRHLMNLAHQQVNEEDPKLAGEGIH